MALPCVVVSAFVLFSPSPRALAQLPGGETLTDLIAINSAALGEETSTSPSTGRGRSRNGWNATPSCTCWTASSFLNAIGLNGTS